MGFQIVKMRLMKHLVVCTCMLFVSVTMKCSAGGTTPGSECEANEFSCSVNGPCVPLAFLCNGVGDCPNSDDESRCGNNSI